MSKKLTFILISIFSILISLNSLTTEATTINIVPTKSNLESKSRLKYITPKQQGELDRIRSKVESGEMLSEKDKQILREINNTVVKAKLGEEKYKEFTNLINKRKKHIELTDDEECRLKILLEELRK